MSIIEELTSDNAIAMQVATALEQILGNDIILGVGRPKMSPPSTDTLPSGSVRVAHLASHEGYEGGIYLVVTEGLGVQLERIAPDEEMLTALGTVFAAITDSIAVSPAAEMQFDGAQEVTADDLLSSASNDHEYALYSFIDGMDRIATLVIDIGPATIGAVTSSPNSSSSSASSSGATGSEASGGSMTVRANAPARQTARTAAAPDNVTHHEFETLNESIINLGESRSLSLLHDVEMGVTAELGRKRMTVRDLLALTPGAVIELDRAAGSPVDVLVNGTLIARGEVVVIDEEFGIRVAEIVASSEATV